MHIVGRMLACRTAEQSLPHPDHALGVAPKDCSVTAWRSDSLSPCWVITRSPPLSLQERALVTYVKRVYFPFVLRDPQLRSVDGRVASALWAYADPATAV